MAKINQSAREKIRTARQIAALFAQVRAIYPATKWRPPARPEEDRHAEG